MRSLKIVFMGTPDFAVASLTALQSSSHQLVGVVTAPDRPAGRGRQPRASAVKDYAVAHGLRILQPTNLKSPEFVEELGALDADLFVVVAFRMLPEVVWQMPLEGTINLHGSLLPQYRGAAPINWAIINGEAVTGVTTFFIEKEIDTGKIIAQKELSIGANETAGELHDRMMDLGARVLAETVDKIAEGSVEPLPQSAVSGDSKTWKLAPKIFPDDCVVDWSQGALAIHNKIRGLSPYPGARTTLAGKSLKVFSGLLSQHSQLQPGQFRVIDGQLFAGTGVADYAILELQLEGKKRMTAEEFLNGFGHLLDTQ
jgi:methionyl-tRNA formyltransferase